MEEYTNQQMNIIREGMSAKMKILWLSNIILPIIAKERGEKVNPYGGWISGLLEGLAPLEEVTVCFPYNFTCDTDVNTIKGRAGKIDYIGFRESDRNIELFVEILTRCKPDVIHIWGTEYRHTLDMVNAAEQVGMINRTIINIQGLVSIYGKYHYYCGLPEYICKSASLAERVRKNNIENGRQNFELRGKDEIAALQKVRHVIGRTDWDEACVKQVNPEVQYHFCNESLRPAFYQHRWDLNTCEPHTIFLSQSQYPIKGFHLMLDAMPLILARFPDTHVYTTGKRPQKPGVIGRLKEHAYPKYIRKQLENYRIEDHVSFLGYLDEQEMCQQFLKANVFVSPSSIENESNSISEAKILGMPVVASFVGGVTNRIEHGVDGFLYQWDAPYMLAYYVCRVFQDNEMAVGLGQCARTRALAMHDRERNLKAMRNIYKTVFSG